MPIDNAPDLSGILDCSGVLLEVNQEAIDSIKSTRVEVIGSKLWDCFWCCTNDVIREQIELCFEEAITGEPSSVPILARMSPNSSYAMNLTLTPLVGRSGVPVHILVTGVIAKKKQLLQSRKAATLDHLKMALAAAQLGTWEWVMLHDSVQWSPKIFEMLGVSESEFGGKLDDFVAIIHPEDRASVNKRVLDAIAGTDELYELECRVIRPADNRIVWVHGRAMVQRDPTGLPISMTGVASDITERKQFEIQMADAKDRLDVSLDAGQMAPWHWDVLNNQIVTNPMLNRMFGYGEDHDLNVDELLERIVDSDRQRIVEAVEASTNSGVKFDEEYTIHWPCGEVRHVRARGRARLSNTGELEDFFGVVVDNTDSRKRELALADREERLAMAMKAGGMAAWEWSETSSYWTPELYDLIGIPRDEPPDPENFFARVHTDDVDALRESWMQAAQGHSAFNAEFRIKSSDGRDRWIVGIGEVVRDEDGNVEKVFGLNWDNTAEHDAAETLKASEVRAQAASRSKTEFLANMSHEIRTPMSAILGYADMLAENLNDPDDLNCVSIIRNNGKFLLDIINDILDISKVEAGKMELQRKVFRVDRLITDIRSLMEARAFEKKLEFDIEISGSIPQSITSDSKRLKQILVNLIGNAIKFTDSGGVKLVLKLLSNDSGNRLQFDVVDTGIGMTPEQKLRLFQPFSQGDSSVDREFGGTGLGLAISQRLAQMLHGEITIESERGRGSTFTLTIDVGKSINANALATKDLDAPAVPPKANKNIETRIEARILIVDDRRDIRFIAQQFIENAGGTVETGENGLDALNAVSVAEKAGSPFDLVVLDMQMPLMDGYEAARQLRKSGFDKPIVALTAHAMEGDRDACIDAGCTDYMPKPIDGKAFVDLVQSYVVDNT